MKNGSSEVQWLKLSKDYLNFENDVYICFTYLAPVHSAYNVRHDMDIMSVLESDVRQLSEKG